MDDFLRKKIFVELIVKFVYVNFLFIMYVDIVVFLNLMGINLGEFVENILGDFILW